MKRVFLFLLAFGWSCDCEEVLQPYCPAGRECWFDWDAPVPALIGVCRAGVVSCSADGPPECVGSVGPTPEICDGLDNDCDGDVDENARIPQLPNCHVDLCGVCSDHFFVSCVAGLPACVSNAATTEVCDGLDNDCDCVADEDLPVEFFYTGPPQTIGIGQCRPGAAFCDHGRTVFVPDVIPAEEVCDEIDNDCDGLVDEVSANDPRAYYLILDISGSMSTERAVVAEAFCDFARAAQPADRFALSTVATGRTDPFVALVRDFTDAADVCAALADPGTFAVTGGTEYMLDPFVLPLTWPDIDVVVIALTDEALGTASVTVPDVQATCAAVPFLVFVFSYTSYLPSWMPIVDTCGGATHNLPASSSALFDAFTELLLDRCP